MNKITVTIIIPVYNTKAYLTKCFESIICQTQSDLEIICIDNGSTDGSFELLKEYQKIYQNIYVDKILDGKQGHLRNIGIDLAKGKYIGFIDSDDFIKKDMFEKMYKKAVSKNADICICNTNYYYSDNKIQSNHFPEYWFDDHSKNIYKRKYLFRNMTPWNKLYKKSFIKENRLVFNNRLYHEDIQFVFKAYCNAKKIVMINDSLYYYRRSRKGSVNSDKSKAIFMIFPVINYLEDDLIRNKLIKEIFIEFKIYKYLSLLKEVSIKYKYLYFKKVYTDLKKIDKINKYEILNKHEQKNFTIINKMNVYKAYLYIESKQFLSKIISIPIIKTIYKFIK